jgi:hypothetical protein
LLSPTAGFAVSPGIEYETGVPMYWYGKSQMYSPLPPPPGVFVVALLRPPAEPPAATPNNRSIKLVAVPYAGVKLLASVAAVPPSF